MSKPGPYRLQQTLPADAPVVAVPMCVKFIDGQNYHTVGEKYLTALIEGSGVYPLSYPALGAALPVEALLDHVDGLLFTGSPSNIAVEHYNGDPDRDDSPQDPGRDAITLPLIRAALKRDIPVICICRGFQELNVALGGTLHTRVHELPGKLDHRGADGPDLTLAQLSILLTLLDQGPIRMTELAARERVRRLRLARREAARGPGRRR